VQTDRASLTNSPPSGGPGGISAGELIARGALLIAVLSAMSRLLGLIRTVVFAQTVGAGCLGTAYVTANTVPNLIYELALGGALASAMVPVLARAASRSGTDEVQKAYVSQITSALLTWAVLILLPVTVAIVAAARPIADLLIPANPNAACARPAMLGTTTDLIVAFAPQILLYGVSVVLTGLLQAYRKFTGPTLAPVIGNVVTITAFLVFASLDKNLPMTRTPLVAQLVLSIGTTLNIGMLVLVALPPTWRLRLRLRPTLRLPPGVIGRAGGLALVGVLEFVAGDVQSVVTIALANGHGDTGALVLVNYSSLVFASVCAVLPIAIVTSVFPALSAADGPDFDRTSAGSTRAVMLTSWLGTAMIAAVAVPAAHILAKQPDQVTQLIQAFLLLAPGVAGYALIVGMSRVLFALGRLKAAGIGLVSGPLLQIGPSGPGPAGGGGALARVDRAAVRGRGADGVRGPAAARSGRARGPAPGDAGRGRRGRPRERGRLRRHAGDPGRRQAARGGRRRARGGARAPRVRPVGLRGRPRRPADGDRAAAPVHPPARLDTRLTCVYRQIVALRGELRIPSG
jgi:putative peptidoglycan lipid II flippase